jgi:acyl-CoA dehydrogenase
VVNHSLLELTGEQSSIVELCQRFSREEIRPIAARMDVQEHEVAWDLWNKASEIGLTSFMIPAEYGGGGMTDMLTSCLIHETLCYGCIALGHLILSNSFFAEGLQALADSGQHERWLTELGRERPPMTAVAVTEPNAGSDAAAIETHARRVDGGYVLNGQKIWISNGGIAEYILLFATVAPGTRSKGITAFVLERGDEGFTSGPPMPKMGQRAQPCAQLYLTDVFLAEDRRVGREGAGFVGMMHTFDRSRLNIASGSVGLAQAAFDEALAYAKVRHTFGRPLIEHQAIAFMLADMRTRIDASRLLIHRAARTIDTADHSRPEESAMAKLFATETATWCTWAAQQIFGGSGYSREFPLEKWARDARLDEIGEGSSEIMRRMIAKLIA